MSIDAMSLGEIHEKTSHVRDKIPPHAMDFGLYPLPCKIYGREGVSISLGAVTEPGQPLCRDGLLPFLSDFLYLSYGVTQTRQAGGIPFLVRTVPSAGGLYPCHLYVGMLPRSETDTVHGDTPETNLFYYEPSGHRLILLRRSGQVPPDFSRSKRSDTALVFIVTACLYNGAWKYRDRAIRYVMLDAGHLVENMVLAGDGQALSVSYDFNDQEIARLLDLEPSREVPLSVATLDWDRSVSETIGMLKNVSPCHPDVRIRPGEISYLEKFPFPAKVHALGRRICRKKNGSETGTVRRDRPAEDQGLPGAAHLPALMTERRSRRNFIAQAIGVETQQALMSWIASAGKEDDHRSWVTLAVACQNWEGQEDGLYAVDQETGALDLMTPGNFNGPLARVCLGQEWVGLAGAVFLCLADFSALEQAGGIRAYRYTMLAAGRVGQRIYIGAEATGQGCCGIGAIYDDEAASLLGLGPDNALIYALAVGPVKKKIS